MARTVGQLGNGSIRHRKSLGGGSKHKRAGRIALHLGGKRSFAAQNIVDEIADRCAVARPGEPVRLAPIGESLCRRAMTRKDFA